MQRQFDLLVHFTRASPFTLAGLETVRIGLSQAPRVLLAIGSADAPRTPFTPWSFDERRAMIEASLSEEERERVVIAPLPDALYDEDRWDEGVRELVARHALEGSSIALIGHNANSSSYFADRFPEFGTVDVPLVPGVAGSKARQSYFLKSDWRGDMKGQVPEGVVRFMSEFQQTKAYDELLDQEKHVANYPSIYGKGPHYTADNMCILDRRILLVRRGGEFGRGLWALPGGFADPGEGSLATSLRELDEETTIDATVAELESCLVGIGIFDDPHRDLRAHVSTNVHLFDLDRLKRSGIAVEAADDAAATDFRQIGDLDPETTFSDHYHVVQRMLAPEGYPFFFPRSQNVPASAVSAVATRIARLRGDIVLAKRERKGDIDRISSIPCFDRAPFDQAMEETVDDVVTDVGAVEGVDEALSNAIQKAIRATAGHDDRSRLAFVAVACGDTTLQAIESIRSNGLESLSSPEPIR